MNMRDSPAPDPDPRRVRAEAAAWVARLHGPDGNAHAEAGVRRWLAEHPAHAAAFELATDAWNDSADLRGGLMSRSPAARTAAPTRFLRPALAISVIGALALAGLHYLRSPGVATGVGEQRTLNLSDGTRVELNTNTRLAVHYDAHERRVILEEGEAFFDVAKHQPQPFVVAAGDRKIIAMGTSFLVRREASAGRPLTVTLLEGRVAVAPIDFSDELPQEPPAEVTVMSAGQRLRVLGQARPTIDSPAADKVTGWLHGQLIFEDTPLGEAATEFNRYSPMTIVAASAEIAAIRVGGVFRIGDSASFARAVADAHKLQLVERGDALILAPTPGERGSEKASVGGAASDR